jgi:hypothetical protein
MNNSVNFLKKQATAWQVKRQKFKLVQIASAILLAVYGIIIIGVFGYYFILKKQGETIKSQLTEVKKVLDSERPVETKQILLKNKLASLTEILTGQTQHQKIIETIFTTIPAGMGINSLAIDPKGGVSFVARTESLAVLNGFLNSLALTSQEDNGIIAEVRIKSFAFDLQRGYSVSIYLLARTKPNE